MTIVVFRKENDRLATVCVEKFKTPGAAKKHIEEDADFFCSKHKGTVKLGWIKPNTLDYYAVHDMEKDVMCFWQYFSI